MEGQPAYLPSRGRGRGRGRNQTPVGMTSGQNKPPGISKSTGIKNQSRHEGGDASQKVTSHLGSREGNHI